MRRQLKTPFVVYTNFESKNIDPSIDANTTKYQEHEACGYAYTVVCEDSRYFKPKGHFLNTIFQDEEEINNIIENITLRSSYPKTKSNFKNANNYHICDKHLGAIRVRDHNHLFRAFRGADYLEFNLNFMFPKKENE